MNSSQKVLLIVNPRAGTQTSTRGIFDMANAFCATGAELTLRITQYSGDATETVKKTGRKYDYIVCSGGDGTLNEVISGMMDFENKPILGYIPSGSTNDFASNLNLKKNNFKKGSETIIKGTPFSMDVGLIEDRPFSYVASFGAFTSVTYTTSQSAKNILGKLAYFFEATKDISKIKPIKTKVTLADGDVLEDEYIFGCVANTLSMAGIINLDGLKVKLDDGQFECLLIKPPANPLELNEIITGLLTHNFSSPLIEFKRSDKFSFEFKNAQDWTIDGEYGSFGKVVNLSVVPRAIKVII